MPYPLPGCGMSRSRKGFPEAVGKWFRGPCLIGFFSFWGKSRGILRPNIPEGFLQVELDSLLELGAVLGDFVSEDPFGEWSQSWFAALDNQETAHLESTIKRTIFGLPTVTQFPLPFRQKNLLKCIFTVQIQKVQLGKKST